MSEALAAVVIGDRIRISVALIKQIAEEPDHASVVVVLTGIVVEDDGSKVLVLQRPQR